MEIDERAFETIDTVNQKWVDRVTKRKEIEETTMSGRDIFEKSDGALTSAEIVALLEQHTRQLQLLESKNAAL